MEKEISEREKERKRKREKKRSRSSLQSKSYIVFNMDNVIEARALTWVHAEFFFFFLLRGRGLEKKNRLFSFSSRFFSAEFPRVPSVFTRAELQIFHYGGYCAPRQM